LNPRAEEGAEGREEGSLPRIDYKKKRKEKLFQKGSIKTSYEADIFT
jgi:hypothetical protein